MTNLPTEALPPSALQDRLDAAIVGMVALYRQVDAWIVQHGDVLDRWAEFNVPDVERPVDLCDAVDEHSGFSDLHDLVSMFGERLQSLDRTNLRADTIEAAFARMVDGTV